MSAGAIVITGASSGIGRATALRLARRGTSLVLVSRREDALGALAEQCRSRGGAAVAVAADVSDAEAVEAVAIRAVVEYGRIDAWVNCAAVATYGHLESVPLEEFQHVIDVNVMGVVNGTRSALRRMIPQGSGVIVNIASILGVVPQPYGAAYSVSKAAVRALGASARSELALRHERDVHVVSILPATIDTPFFRHAANHTGRQVRALPPVYPPELVARRIESALRRPHRPERVVGLLGRALVRQHRRTPRVIEGQVALQTELTNLSPTRGGENGSGTLFTTDASAEASVTGGWHGRSKTALRTAIGTAAAVALGMWMLRRVGKRR
ncbi:SDR family NAD(P)-dependent oxidoreductase [Leifsonia sp. NPDC058292]|uniref:SDR family NAD(P)-dependent oxidoreductase n=1 Tax=Leifsonia sp. NPDC058292 TaxID=3346428 RepID=UPI0036DDAB57